jgi:hypothetical protein
MFRGQTAQEEFLFRYSEILVVKLFLLIGKKRALGSDDWGFTVYNSAWDLASIFIKRSILTESLLWWIFVVLHVIVM